MTEYQLTREILKRSQTTIWDLAKLEWALYEVYEAAEPETCLCGHFPIIEICILKNKFNENSAIVGNSCVKKFIGLPSDKIFQAIKRVRKDVKKSLNAEAIDYAYKKQWINKWEFDFSVDTIRKRNFSTKQLDARKKINNKMLVNMQKEVK